jgi:TRAP-type C4-dicarboxylate transport system substrate-binding protein
MERKRLLTIAGCVCLVLICLVLPFMDACTETGPTAENPLILRWQYQLPSQDYGWDYMQEAAEAIETRTEGRVIVETYVAGELCPSTEVPDALASGVLDIGWIAPGYHPGKLPKTEFLSIPLVWPTGEVRVEMNKELVPKYIVPEWEAVGLKLLSDPSDQFMNYQIFSNKAIVSIDDFRGVQIGVTENDLVTLFSALGMSPMFVPGVELYTNLQKGVVDAIAMGISMGPIAHYYEVANFLILADISFCSHKGWAMDLERFEDLPSDIAKIIEEEVREAYRRWGETGRIRNEEALPTLIEEGMEVLTLSEETRASMIQEAEVLIESWISAQEDAGMKDAREFAEYCIELRDKYLAD